ncbi:TSUP family transporter [Telmatospirillum sp.]|uniref:TSUP family transporter n=1 Tax=Telmatospirillum sp. TaxID=2079197 RepID=UPI0038709209
MIANAGAPPFQVYVIPQRLPKDLFIGTGILFFAALNWFKLPFFVALGQLTRDTMLTSAALFPLAIVSTWAGVLLVRRVPAERFFTVIYYLLIAVGAKLLWDGGRGLI